VREEVLREVVLGIKAAGFACSGTIESPIKGATSGNTEYLAHFRRVSHAESGIALLGME